MRGWMVTIALRAYPPEARAERGREMHSTLLDASAGSRTWFARELSDLIRVGLRARAGAARAAGGSTGRLIADGVCLGAIWLMALDLVLLVTWRINGLSDSLLATWSIALLAASLALALMRLDRLAGAVLLTWTVSRFSALRQAKYAPPTGHYVPTTGQTAHILFLSVLPLACCAVLLLAPRTQAFDVRRLAWLALPAAWLGATAILGDGSKSAVVGILCLIAVALVAAVAAALLPADPRLAIALTLPLTRIGLEATWWPLPRAIVFLALFLLATPVVLVITLARARALQRRAVTP